MIEVSKESRFFIPNSSGHHINLLNGIDNCSIFDFEASEAQNDHKLSDNNDTLDTNSDKRKYVCTEPGCSKAFISSGHLERHFRTHTGEKNFPCIFPGCQSRFSRQDNMMQHYKSHMSTRSKKAPNKTTNDGKYPKPKLFSHQKIQSNSFNQPLTIDQHLSNYHNDLRIQTTTNQPIKYSIPTPLCNIAASRMLKHMSGLERLPKRLTPAAINKEKSVQLTFYEHRPLINRRGFNKYPYPFTLLHPNERAKEDKLQDTVENKQNKKARYESSEASEMVEPSSSLPIHHSSTCHIASIISNLD